jgi:hypothetical protein
VDRIPLDDRGSFAWLAGDWMERASSAIALEGGFLLVDPVDVPGLDVPVIGVTVLFSRHERDADRLAARFGVPRLAPDEIPGVEARRVRSGEWLLWLPERRLLVSGEVVGTGPFYYPQPLGLHPFARLRPPRHAFGGLEPGTIACGHGAPLRENATEALQRAFRRPRLDLPRAWVHMVRAYRAAHQAA